MNQAFYALATLQAFFSDRLDNRKDRGATAVEYGLMVGLIAVIIIVAILALGNNLQGLFQGVADDVANPAGAGAGAPPRAAKPDLTPAQHSSLVLRRTPDSPFTSQPSRPSLDRRRNDHALT